MEQRVVSISQDSVPSQKFTRTMHAPCWFMLISQLSTVVRLHIKSLIITCLSEMDHVPYAPCMQSLPTFALKIGACGFWSIQQFWTNPGPHHIADQIFPVSDKIPSKAIQISYISVDYLYPSTNPIISLFLINNVLYQLYHHLNFSSKEFM